MKTDKEILEIKKYLEDDYYSELNKNYDRVTDAYNQKLDLGKMRKGAVVYNPPTARAQIDTAVDHLMGLKQKAHVPPWAETQKAKEFAGVLEKFTEAFLFLIERKYRFNIRRSCYKNAFLYGCFDWKGPLYVPRMKGKMSDNDFEEYCKRTFPFEFKSVNPRNILSDPAEEFTIEKQGRSVASLKIAWPNWKNPKNIRESEAAQYWEFWSKEQKQYFINDEPLLMGDDTENIYKCIPYEKGNAGFGLESPDGKPEDLIVSMIMPELSSIVSEARLKTAIRDGLERGIFGMPTVEEIPGDDFFWPETPGDMAIVPKHLGFKYTEVGKVTEDAYRMLAIIDADQQSIIPRILLGNWPKGVTSGYMGGIAVGQSKTKFQGTVFAWEMAVSRMMDKILWLTKNVVSKISDEPIGIVGTFPEGGSIVTLKPKDINPSIQHVYVRMEAMTPEEKDRRIMLGVRLYTVGALSWETLCHDYFGVEPTEERKRILIDGILRNPTITQIMAIAAAEDAGMNQIIEAIKSGEFTQDKPPQGDFKEDTRKKMRLEPDIRELGSEQEMTGEMNEEAIDVY